jgi:thiamine pyrophosphokinase
MKQAAIFLNGAYPAAHLDFYSAAIDAAKSRGLVVAADGALNLFDNLGKVPDLVIGDFDSIAPKVLTRFPNLPKIEYPVDKDATDGELAMKYVLDEGYDSLEIYGAFDTSFESDQMLANVMLLALVHGRQRLLGRALNARIVDHRQELYFLEDCDLDLSGTPGDLLSIIPISHEVRITLRGTKWELTDQLARLGSSRTLRNLFSRDIVSVVIAGTAIAVHRRTGSR